MLSTILRSRPIRSAALAVGVCAAILVPQSAARGADAVTSGVSLQVSYQNMKLAGATGTLTWETNSRFSFSFALCWESSYIPPYVSVYVNEVLYSNQLYDGPAVSVPECRRTAVLKTAAFEYGSTVSNVRLTLKANYYNGQVATSRENSVLYDNPLN